MRDRVLQLSAMEEERVFDKVCPRFALVAQPRSGTHFFRSLLNQNDTVFCFGEVLFPWNHYYGFYNWLRIKIISNPELFYPHQWRPELAKFLDELYVHMVTDGQKSHVGFDLKIPHLTVLPDSHEVLRGFGYGIIHLKRINTAAAIISAERASIIESLKLSVHNAKQNVVPTIKINTRNFKDQIWEYQIGDQIVERRFSSGKYVEIYYEDMLTDVGRRLTEEKLSRLFGTPITLAGKPRFARQRPDSLLDNLECDAEVADIIKQFEEQVDDRARSLEQTSALEQTSPTVAPPQQKTRRPRSAKGGRSGKRKSDPSNSPA